MEIKQKVRQFFNRFFKNKDIGDDDNIFELGFVNSLFSMQLVMFLEKEFSLEITNEDLDINNFNSLKAICDFVQSKM
jgi:acyl carrier protein